MNVHAEAAGIEVDLEMQHADPAEDAGLRLAIISGAQFVTATVAGRFSERVPARWLIGPGLPQEENRP